MRCEGRRARGDETRAQETWVESTPPDDEATKWGDTHGRRTQEMGQTRRRKHKHKDQRDGARSCEEQVKEEAPV
ncbi:hypothetical protein AB1N83_014111 [Pleurotus pulmonarius]